MKSDGRKTVLYNSRYLLIFLHRQNLPNSFHKKSNPVFTSVVLCNCNLFLRPNLFTKWFTRKSRGSLGRTKMATPCHLKLPSNSYQQRWKPITGTLRLKWNTECIIDPQKLSKQCPAPRRQRFQPLWAIMTTKWSGSFAPSSTIKAASNLLHQKQRWGEGGIPWMLLRLPISYLLQPISRLELLSIFCTGSINKITFMSMENLCPHISNFISCLINRFVAKCFEILVVQFLFTNP